MVSLSAGSTLTSPTVRSIVDELGALCFGGCPSRFFPLPDILNFIGLQTVDLALCKKGCYTVLYNACIHVLCTRYTRVIRMCITLRMDTLYTVAYNNYSITLCITSV